MDKFVVRKPLAEDITKGVKRVSQLNDGDESVLVLLKLDLYVISFAPKLSWSYYYFDIFFLVMVVSQAMNNQVQQNFQRLRQLMVVWIFQMLITKALIQSNTKFYYMPKPFRQIMNFQNSNLAQHKKESPTCVHFLYLG